MFGTYERLNVSIYASPREVLRAARRKLNPMFLRDRDVRERRHEFYRQMLKYHTQARELAAEWRL
jgi:hypothetical protein